MKIASERKSSENRVERFGDSTLSCMHIPADDKHHLAIVLRFTGVTGCVK